MVELFRETVVREYDDEISSGASSTAAVRTLAERHGRSSANIEAILKGQGIQIRSLFGVSFKHIALICVFLLVCGTIGWTRARNVHAHHAGGSVQATSTSAGLYAPGGPECRRLAAMTKMDLDVDCERSANSFIMRHFDQTEALEACFENHSSHFQACGLPTPGGSFHE